MSKKKMKWYDWVLSLLITIALINWGTVAWFNYNIVEMLSFGVGWIAKTIYSIVAIFGIVGLIGLINKSLK